jgi:hypothetical protein
MGSALVLMALSVLIAALPYLLAQPTAVQRGTTSNSTVTDSAVEAPSDHEMESYAD